MSKERNEQLDIMSKLTLAERLREERTKKGLSLRQVASEAGVDDSNLSKIENGAVTKPSTETLQALSQFYAVPLEDLYSLAGYAAPTELPSLGPYLRSKYDLSPEAAQEITAYFDFVKQKYEQEDSPGGSSSEASPGNSTRADKNNNI